MRLPLRRFLVVALLLLCLVGISVRWRNGAITFHVLQPDVLSRYLSNNAVAAEDREAFCRAHNFATFDLAQGSSRRVYDLFLFSSELDWLEVRLQTLASQVDYFVIVESRTTFTGLKKPLYLEDNWHRFKAFHDRIIYTIVEDPGLQYSTSTWDHEALMRNSLLTSVFPDTVMAEKTPRKGDVLIVSDVDEISKPGAIAVLRYCHFPPRLTLRSRFYYYSFQWRHRGEQWAHPQATQYRGNELSLLDTILPSDLRRGYPETAGGALARWWMNDAAELWDAGWHCSSCFATLQEMRFKMQSFSHTPWNTAENRDAQTMLDRVRAGQDLFGREGEHYDLVERNEDIPEFIKQNGERFGYMLNRDGHYAGFTDTQFIAAELPYTYDGPDY